MKWKKKDVSYDVWQVPALVTSEDAPQWAREELDKPVEAYTRMDVLHRIGDRHRIPTGIGVYNGDDGGSTAEPGDWIARGPDGRMHVWAGDAFELWHEPDQPDAEGRQYLYTPAGAGKTEVQKKAARDFLDTGYIDPRHHTAQSEGADGSTCDWCACEDRNRCDSEEASCDSEEASSPEPPGIVIGDGDSLKAWQTGGAVRFVYSCARPGPGQPSSLSTLLSIDQAIMLASQLKDAARHATSRIDGPRIERGG